MKIIVRFISLLRRTNRLRIWAWIETSSADTDSSEMINSGATASARARPTRWHWPPLSAPGRRPRSSCGSPTMSISRVILRSISAAGQILWTRSTSARVAPTVRRGLSEAKGSWKIIWARRRKASSWVPSSASTSVPSKRMLPASAAVRRSRARPSVLLPQPLSPTRPSVSPRSSMRLTCSTARMARRGAPLRISPRPRDSG